MTCLIAKLSFSPKPSKRPKNKYLKTNWPTVGRKVFSSSFVNLRAFLNKREKTKLSTMVKSNQPIGFSLAKFDRVRTGALPGGGGGVVYHFPAISPIWASNFCFGATGTDRYKIRSQLVATSIGRNMVNASGGQKDSTIL